MSLRKKYKYASGGDMLMTTAAAGGDPYGALIQMGQQIQAQESQLLFKENEYGHQNAFGTAMTEGSKYGTLGMIKGYFQGRKQWDADNQRRFHDQLDNRQMEMGRSATAFSMNPALVTGRPGAELYASGGFLHNRYASMHAGGGELNPMSSNSVEVAGPTHEQGGVQLPQLNSEVEGGESIQGDYVFSDRLGFAPIHKKLARAIGKIEKKPSTPDRLNALKRLHQSVENLKQQQEQVREQYNLE